MNIPITIIGNLGRDVEVRQTKQGKYVSNLTVAVTPREKKNGEWIDAETIWFRVAVWDRLPEVLYVKGTRVIVSGELFQETYEKDGSTIKNLVIKAEVVSTAIRHDKDQLSTDAPFTPGDSPFVPATPTSLPADSLPF
jgi:single-strand DNA-binding protein